MKKHEQKQGNISLKGYGNSNQSRGIKSISFLKKQFIVIVLMELNEWHRNTDKNLNELRKAYKNKIRISLKWLKYMKMS
jgi:formyltetrahydrofolate synthetase